jgi:hypothetical protein
MGLVWRLGRISFVIGFLVNLRSGTKVGFDIGPLDAADRTVTV